MMECWSSASNGYIHTYMGEILKFSGTVEVCVVCMLDSSKISGENYMQVEGCTYKNIFCPKVSA